MAFNIPMGLRLKTALFSLFLFTIPWLGYQFVWEMEKYLRTGQEKTLVGTVRAVATALHERPKLFDSQASFLSNVEKGRDLYAYPIINPIQLDGKLQDWSEYRQYESSYGAEHIISSNGNYTPEELSFYHVVGKYSSYLYAYFQVVDDEISYRPENSLSVTGNDHIHIAFADNNNNFYRYLIATKQPGWLTPYRIDNGDLIPDSRIQGQWTETPVGYNVELRIPLGMLGTQLGFSITDVDLSQSSEPIVTMGTSSTDAVEQLGTILVPSPEIEQILKGLGHTSSRIWVVDQHQRVLASAGDIFNSDGIWNRAAQPEPSEHSWLRWLEENVLHPLYYKILTKPPKNFIDELIDAANLQGSHISKALEGDEASSWRLTPDNKAVILASAYPIFIDNKVMGAVIAEETTHGIRTLRNLALERLFNVILGVMGFGTLALLLFASRISNRIRKLRDKTDGAIDENGRICAQIEADPTRDEIGDLSRSFSNMVERLSQYTLYLEKMSSRLSHELRTPVAVVKSSLETMALHSPPDKESSVYLERAQDGLNRLSTILTNMSEATRLEQSLQTSEKYDFNLSQVLQGCCQGYQGIYPDQTFKLMLSSEVITIRGVPEHIAQLMDKLVANAVEFAAPETDVEVQSISSSENVIITVINKGNLLPDQMSDRLLDSMVSVRPETTQQQAHLGLGLFIARLIVQFHLGQIAIENLSDNTGVKVSVTLPLVKG